MFAPESIDREMVMGLFGESAILHVSTTVRHWEELKPRVLEGIIAERRLEGWVSSRIKTHMSVTGGPITEESVLRTMELRIDDRVHVLAFHDVEHAASCFRVATVHRVMDY